MHKRFSIILAAGALLSVSAWADVKPHPLFSDGMVLQQGMKVPVWGIADEGEQVTVEFRGQKESAVTKDGRWMVDLSDLKASEPGQAEEMVITGKNSIRIGNVVVGEVWVASGQSNMQWSIAWSADPEAELAAADYPGIRFFTVPRIVSAQPQSGVDAQWAVCTPENAKAKDFSVVGYYFARSLHQALGVPVGILHTSWGGTPAESWTSRETLQADPDLKKISDRWDQTIGDYSAQVAKYQEEVKAWAEKTAALDQEGKPVPGLPKAPDDPRANPWRASSLYNAMIAPLVPYAVQGAIWYQGESNAGRAYQYRELFPAMIEDWRKQWGQEQYHFLFVQLANFITGDTPTWAELREAQTMTLKLKDTGMAVITDIGDPKDIHPKNKQEVGRRLALIALATEYGKKNIPFSGPILDEIKPEGKRLRLLFNHADNGLLFKGAATIKGFEVCGEDGQYKPAQACIEGNTLLVWADNVQAPKEVRYNWANNPEGNLFNTEGLPAGPFRTDNFKGLTEGVE